MHTNTVSPRLTVHGNTMNTFQKATHVGLASIHDRPRLSDNRLETARFVANNTGRKDIGN